MYGEPSRIRGLADRLERRAADVRREADALVAAGDRAPWVSLAADRMRERAAGRRADLLGTARRYEDAAAAVRRHAAAVAHTVELVAEAERRVRRLVDRVDDLLPLPDLPPTGHVDWLALADRLEGGRR